MLAERSWSESGLKPFPADETTGKKKAGLNTNALEYAEVGKWLENLSALLFVRRDSGFFGSSATVLDYFFGESIDHFAGYLDTATFRTISGKVDAHHDRRVRTLEERKKAWSDFARQALLTTLGVVVGILLSQVLLK